MRKKLLQNWGLKLTSLLLAFILWFLVVQFEDPKETKRFSNIQVKLTNVELLEKENKVYEVLDNTDIVNVTVRAPGSIISQLRASDIVAEADMSKLTDINTIAISYYVMNTDIEYTIEGNHDVVRLNVEDKVTKYVSLVYNTVGEVAEGYMVGNTSLDQNRIEISGPKSAVEQVSYAKADIDVTGATSSLSANVEIQLYDKEGNAVNQNNIVKQADYAHMAVEVLATKEVPVQAAYTGAPAEGYLVTGAMELAPSRVKIAGSASTLMGISSITIPEDRIDITGADSDVTEIIDIREYLPNNVRLADSSFDGKIAAIVYVEPIVEKSLEIPARNLTITGLPAGFHAELPETVETYTLEVEGLNEFVEPLRAGSITGTIDMAAWMAEQNMTEMRAGAYYVPVTFELAEEVTITAPVTVHVTVHVNEDEQ